MRSLTVVLAFLLFLPAGAGADPCWKTLFEWNEQRPSSGQRLLLLPFENGSHLEEDEWIRYLFPVVLEDYLSLSPKTRPVVSLARTDDLFDAARALNDAKKVGAAYLIFGQFSREGPILQVSARLWDVARESEVSRVSGQVEFPGTRSLNEFLLNLAEQATRSFKKVGVNRKKIHPFLNETISSEALRYFTLGSVALKRGTVRGVKEAIRRFEESIRQDYNYVQAYQGLAHSLARQGFVQIVEGHPTHEPYARSRLELEKARGLRPEGSKGKGMMIERYLEAETHFQLAEGFSLRGDAGKARREWQKAIRLLPGDLASRQRLAGSYEGPAKKVREHEKQIQEMTRCGEEL